MSKLKSSLVGAMLLSIGFAASAATDLTTAGNRYLGLVNDGIPSSLAAEVTYINTLIARPSPSGPTLVGTETYTRTSNDCGGPCPTALLAGAVKDDSPSTTIDLGALGGWEYIIGKYDAAQAGTLVFWIGGLTGEVTIPGNFGTCGSSGCGLSHWSLFNATGTPPENPPLPEPGSLALLGLGLAGLALVRRRKQ